MLLEHLALAARHVAQGEANVRRQRELANKLTLERHAALAIKALDLLAKFEEVQLAHVADRDRISGELSKFEKAEP